MELRRYGSLQDFAENARGERDVDAFVREGSSGHTFVLVDTLRRAEDGDLAFVFEGVCAKRGCIEDFRFGLTRDQMRAGEEHPLLCKQHRAAPPAQQVVTSEPSQKQPPKAQAGRVAVDWDGSRGSNERDVRRALEELHVLGTATPSQVCDLAASYRPSPRRREMVRRALMAMRDRGEV